MTAHVDRDENTTATNAAKATPTSETFPLSNETTVTFFDEDGYEYSLVLTNARDEPTHAPTPTAPLARRSSTASGGRTARFSLAAWT